MVSIVGKKSSESKADAAGRRRGNTTFGPNRRGNRNGRGFAYPQGTVTFNVNLRHLSDRECAIAILLGNGNIAKGIRRALNTARLDERDEDAPMTRFAAETFVKLRKGRIKAGVFENDAKAAHARALNNFGEESAEDAGIDWDDSTKGD